MNVETLAMETADDLIRRGARGVALVGSYARGDAHPYSDLDLVALGVGEPRLVVRDGLLVSESWISAADSERIWYDVGYVGQVVPGWRSARAVADPHGEIAALKQRAADWTWDSLGDAPERWVAQEFPGYAEEVFRLVGHLSSGRHLPAAVMRNVVANRMAWTLAVYYRLLYESENRLWELVADHMGPEWLERQRASFGLLGSFEESCWAAMDLFAMTAAAVHDPLDAEQQAVVARATEVTTEARPISAEWAAPGLRPIAHIRSLSDTGRVGLLARPPDTRQSGRVPPSRDTHRTIKDRLDLWMAPPRLEDGEVEIWGLAANRRRGWRAVGGWLCVTDRRVCFSPNRLDRHLGYQHWAADRAEVTGVAVSNTPAIRLPGAWAERHLLARQLFLRVGDREEQFTVSSAERAAEQFRSELQL